MARGEDAFFSEGLRPSDSPTRSLASRFVGSLPPTPKAPARPRRSACGAKAGRSRGSLTAFARDAVALECPARISVAGRSPPFAALTAVVTVRAVAALHNAPRSFMRASESEPAAELEPARAARAADSSELGVVDPQLGIVVVLHVQHVERFGTDLHPCPIRDREILGQRHVHVRL